MTPRLQVLCFVVGGRSFAVDIMGIREILRNQRFTPVPHTPPHVAGVLNLRGELIPVVDVHRVLLGHSNPHPGEDSKLIVAHARGKTAGLLVDELMDVISVQPESLAPVPGAYGDPDAPAADSVVVATFRRPETQGGDIVVLLRSAVLVEGAGAAPAAPTAADMEAFAS